MGEGGRGEVRERGRERVQERFVRYDFLTLRVGVAERIVITLHQIH